MTKHPEGPPRWGCAAGPEVVCLAANGASDNTTRPDLQDNFRDPGAVRGSAHPIGLHAVDFTCPAVRADELREGLIREITRAAAIGNQAITCLLDGYDDAAVEALRQHWIVMRAGIAPMAAELGRLNGEAAP
jgi:hypothetical protein